VGQHVAVAAKAGGNARFYGSIISERKPRGSISGSPKESDSIYGIGIQNYRFRNVQVTLSERGKWFQVKSIEILMLLTTKQEEIQKVEKKVGIREFRAKGNPLSNFP
jgi:hypothetical protein